MTDSTNSSDSAGGPRFSSRWTMILSILGIAVGTGNIWRFPRIAAQNGGEDGAGAFIVAWIIFLLIWSVPLIIAEYAMGRKSRMGVVGAFVKIAGEKFAWMGAFVGFVATAIMFYYSVVAGWCLYYFTQMVINPLPQSTEAATAIWDGFQAGGLPVLFHGIAIAAGGLVVWRGIGSIEKVNRILVPSLLVIVLISVIRAITLPGAMDGISFLFTPSWGQLAHPQIWLEALTQNAWDTGAGWGLILCYAVYMKNKDGVVKNAFLTGFGNNIVSLLAAVMIFGTVFAILGGTQGLDKAEILSVMQNSGPASTGLTFIWMPQLYGQMQMGGLLAILFFLGLYFAAFSSLISMIELSTRTLIDWGFRRKSAITIIVTVGFLIGAPSALNLDFFANQDFVWGVALMISGAFIAFAVIKYGAAQFRKDAIDTPGDWTLNKSWDIIISMFVPVQAIILLGWWMYLSASSYAPDWYNVFSPYSVMTCVAQWSIALIVFIFYNKKMAENLQKPESTVS